MCRPPAAPVTTLVCKCITTVRRSIDRRPSPMAAICKNVREHKCGRAHPHAFSDLPSNLASSVWPIVWTVGGPDGWVCVGGVDWQRRAAIEKSQRKISSRCIVPVQLSKETLTVANQRMGQNDNATKHSQSPQVGMCLCVPQYTWDRHIYSPRQKLKTKKK